MTFGLPETADKTLGAVSFEKTSVLLEGKSALVIGPGLGSSREVFRLIEKVVRGARVPVVIDADGLNALDGRLQVLKDASEKNGTNMVLTPHPGEAARLLKIKTREVQADRLGAAEAIAERTNCIVVLKGACTIVAVPGDKRHGHSVPGGAGEVYFNTTGNAGLASAGTGDVLSGMIGGLLAQGYMPLEAALGAVYVHGLAADRLAQERGEAGTACLAGLVATDLLPIIPGVLNSFTRSRRGP
jgi:NAD(P)H-hydrate epimerase